MYTGKVVGSVVATTKDPSLSGIKLLVVRRIENGAETDLFVAADGTRQAGNGDFVYLIPSAEAAMPFRDVNRLTPSDATIVGFIEFYNEELPCELQK